MRVVGLETGGWVDSGKTGGVGGQGGWLGSGKTGAAGPGGRGKEGQV